jgi:hypothetical protein
MRMIKPGFAAVLLAIAACGDDGMPGACTALFATVGVTVVDGAGQPVPDASVTATLLRTGEVLVPTTLMLPVPGNYILVDDGSTNAIRRAGESVQARVSRGTQSATVDYVISVPDGCHVNKVSGPDTVTLE